MAHTKQIGTARGRWAVGMAMLALAGTLAGPQPARADKDKGGKGPIVGPIVITKDPAPKPPTPKK